MTIEKIKRILASDIGNKKSFTANWDTRCDSCGNPIDEGDDFVFMGKKEKICFICQGEILEFLEEE